MFDRALSLDAALNGAPDVSAIVAAIPDSYTVKGMFCGRFADMLGSDYEQLEGALAAPPRGRRYLPFRDYPQADYTRIVAAAAAKRFPQLALAEAVRRLARDDLATFAASTFGKVLLTLILDVRTTLLRAPEAYHRVAPGATVSSMEVDEATVRLTFDGHHGIVAYTLGQLEGIVLSFKRKPIVTVRRLGETTLTFDVVHGA